MLSTVRICYPWRYLFEIPSYARHHAVYIRYLRRFREIKFLTSASSTSRNLLHPCDLVDVLPFPQMKDDNCSLLPVIFRFQTARLIVLEMGGQRICN